MTIEAGSALPQPAILTGRGTTALWAVLSVIKDRGPFVLVPANICEIVIPAVLKAGFKPVFYDVSPEHGNATLETIRRAHCHGIGTCLAVHNFGTPLDIGPVADWAEEANVFLIEDACNALGATWHGRPVGDFGDAAIFSFGHGKILELGQGGALHVRDEALREMARHLIESLPALSPGHRQADEQFQAVVRALRQNPLAAKPAVYRALYNAYLPHLLFRPDEELKQAIAHGLLTLGQNLSARLGKARLWRQALDFPGVGHRPNVAGDVCWRYTVLMHPEARDHVLEALRQRGFPASKWFPPIPGLFKERVASKAYSGAERFASRCLNLFVDQHVSKTDIQQAARLIDDMLRAM